jgi:hypothetical protein
MEIELNYLTIVTGLSLSDNNLVELNWCIYNISTKEIQYESSNVIKLSKSIDALSNEDKSILITNMLADFSQSTPLQSVIKLFNDSIKNIQQNINEKTKQVKTIGFIFQSEKIENCLVNCFRSIKETDYCETSKLLIYNKYDLFNEFCKFYKLEKQIFFEEEISKSYLIKMLEYFNLKVINSSKTSCTELNSIARIVNKMNRDGFVFKIQVSIKSSINYLEEEDKNKNSNSIILLKENNDTSKREDNLVDKMDSKAIEETIRLFKNNFNNPEFQYVKISVFPSYANKIPIFNLIKKYNVDENDIVKCVDLYGRQCGVYLVRVLDDYDFNELLSNMNL